jgi:hypothetical protein
MEEQLELMRARVIGVEPTSGAEVGLDAVPTSSPR